jgi:transcriptional regulator with XRE-family HTH domain
VPGPKCACTWRSCRGGGVAFGAVSEAVVGVMLNMLQPQGTFSLAFPTPLLAGSERRLRPLWRRPPPKVMATALAQQVDARDVLKCDRCGLTQFAPQDPDAPCKRCHVSLSWVPELEVAVAPPAPTPTAPEGLAALAQVVRDLRMRAGLSQRGVAKKMGTARTWVSKVELGYCVPIIPTLSRLAQALGVSVFQLLRATEDSRAASHNSAREELLSDPLVAQILPFVSSLSDVQRRQVLAKMTELATRAIRISHHAHSGRTAA